MSSLQGRDTGSSKESEKPADDTLMLSSALVAASRQLEALYKKMDEKEAELAEAKNALKSSLEPDAMKKQSDQSTGDLSAMKAGLVECLKENRQLKRRVEAAEARAEQELKLRVDAERQIEKILAVAERKLVAHVQKAADDERRLAALQMQLCAARSAGSALERLYRESTSKLQEAALALLAKAEQIRRLRNTKESDMMPDLSASGHKVDSIDGRSGPREVSQTKLRRPLNSQNVSRAASDRSLLAQETDNGLTCNQADILSERASSRPQALDGLNEMRALLHNRNARGPEFKYALQEHLGRKRKDLPKETRVHKPHAPQQKTRRLKRTTGARGHHEKPAAPIDVKHSRCECGASVATFGIPNDDEQRRWCASCPNIPENAVSLGTKLCKCGKAPPNFAPAGQNCREAARWCSNCPEKPHDAVDITCNRCVCGAAVPSFGLAGGECCQAQWCSKCPEKPQNAANVTNQQ